MLHTNREFPIGTAVLPVLQMWKVNTADNFGRKELTVDLRKLSYWPSFQPAPFLFKREEKVR